MRPVLMLLVGPRGVRMADMCAPLAGFADVVLATSEDILAGRLDRIDGTVPAAHVVRAPDRKVLVEHCLEYAAGHRLDGVLTFSDDLLPDVARVAAECGLPGQPVESIDVFRDKYAQRRALAAGGLPVPAYARIAGPDDLGAAARVPLPAILKPTRGSGSSLAHVIREPGELVTRLREGFAAAPLAGGAVDADTEFILEELLVGDPGWHEVAGLAPYVSVESVAVGGVYRHLAVTDRFPLAPPVLETGMVLPSSLPADRAARVVAAADAALRALRFRHGLAHVELMLTAAGPVVIEVNARAGGALPYLFPMATGVDLVALAGRAALGELPPAAPPFTCRAVFVAPQHPVGVRVLGVDGLEEVARVPGVRAVIPLSAGPGRTDHFQGTLIAAVLGVTADPAAAVTLWRQVMDSVRPSYAAGGAA